MKKKFSFSFIEGLVTLLLLLGIVAACIPITTLGQQPGGARKEEPLLLPIYTPTSTPPIINTAVPKLPDTLKTPEPLRFTLPTPGQAPISLWRPALYQIPWALGPYDHFYFSRPIGADEVNWPLADYRYGGIFTGTEVVHTGVDIDAPKGTPVLAAADGTVVWSGYGFLNGNNDPDDPYGQAVSIRHDFGYKGQRLYTVYAHMDRLDVSIGQVVQSGTQIGLVGETGNVTGPHLHFEVRLKNNTYFTTLNPELWLAPPQGWGLLVGHMQNTNGSLLDSQEVTVRSKESGHKWIVRSYGPKVVNADPYYDENVALSDLPAGQYQIIIDYLEDRYQQDITIRPGAITYFSFRGGRGFNLNAPALSSPEEWLSQVPNKNP